MCLENNLKNKKTVYFTDVFPIYILHYPLFLHVKSSDNVSTNVANAATEVSVSDTFKAVNVIKT